MIVSRGTFATAVEKLKQEHTLAVDTETTGLRPYHGSELFSIVIASATESFYFSFIDYPDLDDDFILREEHLWALRNELFTRFTTWVMHNARFDMAMLKKAGIELRGRIIDTRVLARLLFNDHFDYSLAACCDRIGKAKSGAVDAYIEEHGLWEWQQIPGKKTRTKQYFFSKVPFDIISRYGEQDGRITYDLYRQQCQDFQSWEFDTEDLLPNESELLSTVFAMEDRGVLVDQAYCKKAILFEETRLEVAVEQWRALTGLPFKDSPTTFQQVIPTTGRLTETGRQSYDGEALLGLSGSNPIAKTILDWREAKKRLDLYHGFLYHADHLSLIHSNFDQAGTKTGRFSSSSPNLQQLSKDDDLADDDWPVRRAIVPRADHIFVMFDYNQQEYRLMLDYAGSYVFDRRLIEQVLGGLDVHQATALSAGITRPEAKTVNFSILFGAGLDLLASRLRTTRERADEVRNRVFGAAPEIKLFLKDCTRTATDRGFIKNWLNRRWHCPDPKFAYKAPNFICQGGGADVMKVGANRVHRYLEDKRSQIVLLVHDELVLEVHKTELAVIPDCRAILEKVYPYKYLPLTVGVEWSDRSLADKKPWSC